MFVVDKSVDHEKKSRVGLLNKSCARKQKMKCSLREQPTSREVATWALAKQRLSNDRRNSVLMTRHYVDLGLRFFGRIRKRICDPRSYGFFKTKETQNPKKDYFVMTRQAGGTQFIY